MKTRREFLKGTATGGLAGIIAAKMAPAHAKQLWAAKIKTVSMEQAQEVHDKCLIFDGHNDTPVERVHRGERPLNWMQQDFAYHADIPRMKAGGYDGGFFIVGNGPTANVWVTTELVLQQIEQHPYDFIQVYSSYDMLDAKMAGKIGIVLSIEGIGRWIDGNPETLLLLHRLGLRLAGITHGEGGSDPKFLQGTRSTSGRCTPQDRADHLKNAVGLTPFGHQILRISNEMGIVTDLSHINDRAYFDVIERTSKPPVMSHTAVFSLCNHWRCLTDDQIRALAGVGGVMGIIFVPSFINPEADQATVDNVVEHILYVRDMVGIDYVGIGTDFDGTKVTIVPEVSQLVLLTKSMLEHDMTEEEIMKVWGGNFMRVLSQNIDI